MLLLYSYLPTYLPTFFFAFLTKDLLVCVSYFDFNTQKPQLELLQGFSYRQKENLSFGLSAVSFFTAKQTVFAL